mgnify:CR=1 FL=1
MNALLNLRRWPLAGVAVGLVAVGVAAFTPARRVTVDPRLLAGLEWRNVGPFRSGRVAAVAGVAGQPDGGGAGREAAAMTKRLARKTWWALSAALLLSMPQNLQRTATQFRAAGTA